MRPYTIGFTKKTAEEFFILLKKNKVKKLLDIRLNNSSQLAGFAKHPDLEFFLKEIASIGYAHDLDLAPTKEILDDYRKGENKKDWGVYEQKFNELITNRKIELKKKEEYDDTCLLCSEATAEQCHRCLVAERMARNWNDVEIIHL